MLRGELRIPTMTTYPSWSSRSWKRRSTGTEAPLALGRAIEGRAGVATRSKPELAVFLLSAKGRSVTTEPSSSSHFQCPHSGSAAGNSLGSSSSTTRSAFARGPYRVS